MTSGRHADAAFSSVGEHLGPDLLHIISPVGGLGGLHSTFGSMPSLSAEEKHVCPLGMRRRRTDTTLARGVGAARVAKRSVELMSSSGTPRYLAYEA